MSAFNSLTFTILLFVKVCVVALVAVVWARALAHSKAATRHAVCTTALIVILLLPLLSLSNEKVWIPVAFPESSRDAGTPAVSSDHPTRERASRDPVNWRDDAWDAPRRVPWAGIAWGLYVVGVAAVLIQFGLGMRQAYRIAGRATSVDSHAQWRDSLSGIDRPKFRSRVSVVTSSEIKAPIAFGILRPVVVVPQDVAAWPDRQRQDALIHEFAHVSRFDWGFQVVATLACALHWFNPLVWMVARRLQLEAERSCDERVVQHGTSPHDYARQLVALTRRCSTDYLRTTIAMSSDAFLAGRVTAIMKHRRAEMTSRLSVTVAAVVVTACGVLLAPLAPTSASKDGSTKHTAGLSPLMEAARDGNASAARRLIAEASNVNERRHARGTPLILAATRGHDDVVALLIEAGADINGSEGGSPRDLMRTPLTAAAREGHREIVERLIESGARIDAAPPGDATALMEAAKNNHPQIVALLIDNGADVRVEVEGDGNAIIAAAYGGNVDIAKMIVRAGADVNAGVPGDGNALIIAVRQDDRKMIEYLLSQGADPTLYVPGDESAIVAAAERGDTRLLRMLLDAAGE